MGVVIVIPDRVEAWHLLTRCDPLRPGHGVHRYVFQVFALGPGEALKGESGRDVLRDAVLSRGLASGWLIGTYERPSGAIAEPLSNAPLRTN